MVTDDLDVYLSEFGEPAIASGRSIAVIFDNDYAPALDGFAEGRQIVACGKTKDLEGLHHGDSLLLRGKSFAIVGIQPIQDGRFTDLILKEN